MTLRNISCHTANQWAKIRHRATRQVVSPPWKGLNLLSAPGNDLVAATALASCGCHMVLFTTGRGTPFGTFVPTMKISTNSTLAKNKPGWIDFNAGVIVENEPMEKTCERFIDYIIRVASGEPVNNEKKNYREIAIFKTGVTL